MNYVRIELVTGTPLDAFYPRIGSKFNWSAFGTSVQAIQLSQNVVTGAKEADGDYIYILPIVDMKQAESCKRHLETFEVVKSVTFLTADEAKAEKKAIEDYKKTLKVQ